MDINNLCYGCMREKDSPEGTCPYCGFNRTAYETERSVRALPTGTILNGKYILGKVLGEGGFGITYLAMDLNLEMPVAIKEYFPVGLASRDTFAGENTETISVISGEKQQYYEYGIRSFSIEAENLKKFQNIEGIVSVKDFFKENRTAYLVMEYINGQTLKQYLKERNTPFSEDVALRFIKPVLNALAIIHGAEVIHRDISPENIMITKDDRVVLIDFGAARISTGAETKSLTILLKHGYAPVEQYQTKGKQGPYTDIYAICATIYWMLSGIKPEEAVDRVIHDDLIPLHKLGDRGVRISEQTSLAVQKGMAVHAEDRFQTIDGLLNALYINKKDNITSDNHKTVVQRGSRKKSVNSRKVFILPVVFVLIMLLAFLPVVIPRIKLQMFGTTIEVTEVEKAKELVRLIEENSDIQFQAQSIGDAYQWEYVEHGIYIKIDEYSDGKLKRVLWANYPFLSCNKITEGMNRSEIEKTFELNSDVNVDYQRYMISSLPEECSEYLDVFYDQDQVGKYLYYCWEKLG